MPGTFAAHGYNLPLTPVPRFEYSLPAEAEWPEYEQALLNAFCDFARQTGQWEG